MPEEKYYDIIKKATIYDMRLIVKSSEKQNYTKEELLDFFDVIAASQDDD